MADYCDFERVGGDAVCRVCGRTVRNVRSPRVYAYCRPAPLAGPGTELKALLKTIGIVASPTCSCNRRAKLMDEKGCDWCEENLATISGWLEEEATNRGLPYLHTAGKLMVRLAIRRARKKGNGSV